MFLILVTAASLNWFFDPQPAQSAAPVPSAPMRVVVYKFSDSETTDYTTDQGGAQYTTNESQGGLAAPPQSSTSKSGYSGTMTVDILQVDASGFIKADVHELTDAINQKGEAVSTFVVRPDGTLIVVSATYDNDMTTLMPYFGSSYYAGVQLAQGSTWINDSTADSMQLETTSTVTNVNGNYVTIQSIQKAKQALMNGSFKVETKIVYDAPKLVPISVDVLVTRNGSGTTANAVQRTHYRFDRVSDTLDPAGNGG